MDMPTSSPNISEEVCYYIKQNSPWIYSSIFMICALGIPLNLLVLLVFLLHQKKCTATEIYLSNMAAADLLLVVFVCFWAVSEANDDTWTFGELTCTLFSLPVIMNYNCSIYFLVLVSIDRFFALVHPLKQCKLRRRKYAMLACFLVWCLGFLINIPILMCRKGNLPYNETEKYTCSWDCSISVYYAQEMAHTIAAFIIPLLIILFCTVKIVHVLTTRLSNKNRTQQMEHKATILVLAVFLAFFICWTPFSLTRMIVQGEFFIFFQSCLQPHLTISNIFLIVGFFNSDLNPILYVIVSKNFRKKMREVVRGQWSMRMSNR